MSVLELTVPHCANEGDKTNWYGVYDEPVNDRVACEYCYQHILDKDNYYLIIANPSKSMICTIYSSAYRITNEDFRLTVKDSNGPCWLIDKKNDTYDIEISFGDTYTVEFTSFSTRTFNIKIFKNNVIAKSDDEIILKFEAPDPVSQNEKVPIFVRCDNYIYMYYINVIITDQSKYQVPIKKIA
jgi:hypothetical protein